MAGIVPDCRTSDDTLVRQKQRSGVVQLCTASVPRIISSDDNGHGAGGYSGGHDAWTGATDGWNDARFVATYLRPLRRRQAGQASRTPARAAASGSSRASRDAARRSGPAPRRRTDGDDGCRRIRTCLRGRRARRRMIPGPTGSLLAELEAVYKDLHAHPELSLQEQRTSGIAAAWLERCGWEVTAGIGKTGVVGMLRNGEGPTVLLRADMDALPVAEATGLPYASRARGTDRFGNDTAIAHACGHDMHVAWLMGATRLLAESRDRWHGTVLAVFQPAEETGEGARGMIEDGLLRRFPAAGRRARPACGSGTGRRDRLAGRHRHGRLRQLGGHPLREGRSRLHAAEEYRSGADGGFDGRAPSGGGGAKWRWRMRPSSPSGRCRPEKPTTSFPTRRCFVSMCAASRKRSAAACWRPSAVSSRPKRPLRERRNRPSSLSSASIR